MGFMNEFKREMRNAIRDVDKEANKTWKVEFQGHLIEVVHQMKEEHLMIDGIVVDKHVRTSILSYLTPYSHLTGTLNLGDGQKHTVSVRLGGFSLKALKCRVKINQVTVLEDSRKLEFLPWNHKEKILPYIQHQIQTHGKIVDDRLPDDDYVYDENHPRQAAGLSDLILDHEPVPFLAKKLLKLFKKQIHHPSTKTRSATYEEILSEHIVNYREDLIECFKQAQLDETLVQREALWLLEHATHREVVKFALTVLGCTDSQIHMEILLQIGMHEEFTAYVVFIFVDEPNASNESIWELAQSVYGWGKLVAVEHLEATTPEIKQWLLTKGGDGLFMHKHFVFECALKGELARALYPEQISKELYDGAGHMIQALLDMLDPDPEIEEYLLEEAILFRYVGHARFHCRTIEDFHPLMSISTFLNSEKAWEGRSDDLWMQQERASIQQELQGFLDDPNCPVLAMEKV
ncbi:hypothetical protein SY83_09440 [Paenibacillus swuensis]|uniref:Limonene hydroxylase n=1 Tax=Paenibacillus swuensis TaxID=1178515 RepID=A0A172THE5_9BACL|nr:hypothetical protein [Paenibacillus swuensis]ANE46461.1 hypothetical protein SY83_09440 [Paenibacillus swuensis]